MITEFNSLGYVLLELDADDNVIKHYTIADELNSFEYEDATYCYVNNGHGDVAFVADSTGAIVNTYSYNAYGKALICDEKISNAFRYTGEYYDAESGLYYLRARYMNPATGTFTQEDTYQGNIYDALSLHKYLYAQDNPVIYKDPTGNMCSLVECVVAAGAVPMQKIGEVWAAYKALKILKKVSVISDVIEIAISIEDILVTNDKDEILKKLWDIGIAFVDIFLTISGIDIGKNLKLILSIHTYYEDLKNIKEDLSDEYKLQGVLLAIGDILVLLKDIVLDIADRKLGGNQKALLELTKEEKKLGGIASDIKEILYGWGREYHCVFDLFGEIFNLW